MNYCGLTNLKTINMVTLKEIFESDNLIITKIIQGKGVYRIDAKLRFPIADQSSFISIWGSIPYINRLALHNYGKKANEFNCFNY